MSCLLKYLCRVEERCVLPLPEQVHFGEKVDIRFDTKEKVLALPNSEEIVPSTSWYFYQLFDGITQGATLKWRIGTKKENPQNIRKYGGKKIQICKKMAEIKWSKINWRHQYHFESLAVSGKMAKHVLYIGIKISHLREM